MPDASARLPPALATAQRGNGSEQPAHLAHVWHPARESWDWLAAGAEREWEGFGRQARGLWNKQLYKECTAECSERGRKSEPLCTQPGRCWGAFLARQDASSDL